MTIRVAVTPGEPAGIGPDIVIQSIQKGSPHELVVYADPDMLVRRARKLGLPIKLREPDSQPNPLQPGELAVTPTPLALPEEPGILESANSKYVLNCLDAAIRDCQMQRCSAIVTGPVNKSIINQAGIVFSGHTEYLAKKTDAAQVVMMLASPEMRVALATTHLPLKLVSETITNDLLRSIIDILYRDLQSRFGIPYPRILVCGLNPHAGESGYLGHEDSEIISPVVKEMCERGRDILGPLPADTIFTNKFLANADVVLAMYHDQGLPVLKYRSFGEAANITLGLPIIRTSVDHGTALELAGTGHASCRSFKFALEVALQMTEKVMD